MALRGQAKSLQIPSVLSAQLLPPLGEGGSDPLTRLLLSLLVACGEGAASSWCTQWGSEMLGTTPVGGPHAVCLMAWGSSRGSLHPIPESGGEPSTWVVLVGPQTDIPGFCLAALFLMCPCQCDKGPVQVMWLRCPGRSEKPSRTLSVS